MPLLPLFEKLSAKTGKLSPILTPQRLMRIAAGMAIWVIVLGIAAYLDPKGAARAARSLLVCGTLAGAAVFLVLVADTTVKILLGKRALDGKLGMRLATALSIALLVCGLLWLTTLLK